MVSLSVWLAPSPTGIPFPWPGGKPASLPHSVESLPSTAPPVASTREPLTCLQKAVRSAEEKVKEFVQRKMEDHMAQSVVVPVPQHAIGRLIGRGGANIRSVQRESGAKVSSYESHL